MDGFKKILVFISGLFNQKQQEVVIQVTNKDTSDKKLKKTGSKKSNRDFHQIRWK